MCACSTPSTRKYRQAGQCSAFRRRASMSDDAYGATVAKRRLSRGWPSCAARTGYTANHVCDILNWGRGKVGRFEANQWKRPEMSDIRDLIRIYEVEGARAGRDRGTRGPLPGPSLVAGVRRDLRQRVPRLRERRGDHPGLHAAGACPACSRRRPTWRPSSSRAPRPPAWRRKAVKARLRRQEILDRTDGTAPRAVRGDHRGLAALPVGDAQRPQGADRAPGGDEQAAQRRAAHPAVRRRAADRHLLHGQHLRLPRQASRPSCSWRPTTPSKR